MEIHTARETPLQYPRKLVMGYHQRLSRGLQLMYLSIRVRIPKGKAPRDIAGQSGTRVVT
jgi:hypothetical protein